MLLFTSFLGQIHPSWVLVLVHSRKQGMLRHFSSLGLNFLLYKPKLRILDVSPLLCKGKMLNLVGWKPQGATLWLRVDQSYSAAVQRNGSGWLRVAQLFSCCSEKWAMWETDGFLGMG